MSQSAEIRFKYVIDGNGFQQINALTGEVMKLAAAEDKARSGFQAIDAAAARVGKNAAGVGAGFSRVPVQSRFGPDSQAERIAAMNAPRLGERPEAERARADNLLVRAIEQLAIEMRRMAAAFGGGGPVANAGRGPGYAGGGGGGPPGATGGAGGGSEGGSSATVATGGAGRTGWTPRQVGGLLGGIGAAVQIGSNLATQNAQPFMDPDDRFWAGARQFNIPGTNIGVGGLRDIQLWLQRQGSGKNRDEEARGNLEVENFDARVRRPYEAFRAQFGPAYAEARQRAHDAFGPIAEREWPVPDRLPDPGEFRWAPGLRGLAPRPDVPGAPKIAGGEGAEPPGAEAARLEAAARRAHDQRAAEYRAREAERAAAVAFNAGRGADRFAPAMPLPALPDTARGTLDQERRYRERQELMPARDARVMSEREARALDVKVSELEQRVAGYRQVLAGSEAKYRAADEAAKNPKQDGGFSAAELKGRRTDAAREALTNLEKLREAEDAMLALRQQQAQSRGGLRDAGIEIDRVGLRQLRGREDVSAGQATRLGMMGIDGRMMAQAAFEAVRQIGVRNAPGELIQQAGVYAPETIRKMAEQAGVGPQQELKRTAPDEVRDLLPDVRKDVDALQQRIRAAEQENLGEILRDAVKAFADVGDRYEQLRKELKAFIQQIDTETRQRNKE